MSALAAPPPEVLPRSYRFTAEQHRRLEDLGFVPVNACAEAGSSPSWRFTAEEYHRLDELEFFEPEDRVELLDGEIFTMSPIGILHSVAVRRCTRLFTERARGRYVVSPQLPVHLDELSEPQPDIVLLQPDAAENLARHPRNEDSFLVIEISDSTLRFNRGRKLRAYARAGIREVWIVNLRDDCVEIFRAPAGDSHAETHVRQGDEMVSCQAFPDVSFPARDLLPRLP